MTRHGVCFVVVAGSILASLILGGTASAAQPATVSGDLISAAAKLPGSAKSGSAQVMAMNIDTGAYGDADNVGSNGHYALSLPAGTWALRTSALTGKRYSNFLSAAIVTKSGENRTLPLTLRKFKKPRKRRRRHGNQRHPHGHPPSAGKSNVNPKDGRPYSGAAYAFKDFEVASSDAELGVFQRGMPDMLMTDLVASDACPFTIVEWERRAEIEREIELEQSEYFDPATRIEPGHLIDPEVFIRGRIEDRPGSPPRHAIVVWLEDAKTGARISEEVSAVSLRGGDFEAEQRLAKLLVQDLICGGGSAQPAGGGETTPPPPPPPKPVSNVFQGAFSGSANGSEGALQFEWSGNVRMDAAQDSPVPPPGGPPGEYRLFTVTSGSVHINLDGTAGECVLSGNGDFELGPSNGDLMVQLDVDNPAYSIDIFDNEAILHVTKSGGEGCEEEFSLPAFGVLAETKQAHVSPSTTLSDSESHSEGEGTGFNYTTRWNLSPG